MISRTLVAALVVAASLASACAPPPVAAPGDQVPPPSRGAERERTVPTRDAEPVERSLALATFDSAWSRINSSYYDPDFRGLDWNAVRDELRPSAEAVETRGELRALLRDMLSRLGESHFALFPQESVDRIALDDDDTDASGGAGDVGLELRWVEGELTVVRVGPGAAQEAGIRSGFVFDEIGSRPIAEWKEVIAETESESARIALETQTVSAAEALLAGAVGTSVRVRFRGADDDEGEAELERGPVRGEIVQFGQLPAMAAHLDFERRDSGESCVGLIAFNIWMLPLVAPFNEAVDRLDDCDGIVIDLRGNRGGLGAMVMSTAGSFFAEQADLGVLKSRSGELRFVAMPRGVDTQGRLREPFRGRLAVLVDEMSMSTSEIFAAGLKASGRARIFGTTTPGYALPAMTIRLPSQDVLYHVVSDLTDPEGGRIEGRGVAPDVAVPRRRAALLAGHDEALEAALAWAGQDGVGGARY